MTKTMPSDRREREAVFTPLRGLRVRHSGAVYHVINRVDRPAAIFRDDGDRQRLLQTLAE